MGIHVMYYGMLAEITGVAEEVWPETSQLTVGGFRNQVSDKYPAMREKKFKIAVNQQISEDFVNIDTTSEVALLPPFAGG